MSKVVIDDFSKIGASVALRVEAVDIEDGEQVLTFYVREMTGRLVKKFQQSLPDVVTEELPDGTKRTTTLNSTSNIDMAMIVANTVVDGTEKPKLLRGGDNGAREWSALPSRILQPLMEKATALSGLQNTAEENEGND